MLLTIKFYFLFKKIKKYYSKTAFFDVRMTWWFVTVI